MKLLAVLLLSTTVAGVGQTQLPTRRVLTLEAARRAAAAAEAEARRHNWAVSIAVVDDSGQLLLFQRMDGAKLVAIDIAIRKARTAAYFQGPTKDLEAEVAGGRTALLPIDGFMPLEGGVPLVVGGEMVGAIGVSGVTGAQDAQCALAGARALEETARVVNLESGIWNPRASGIWEPARAGETVRGFEGPRLRRFAE